MLYFPFEGSEWWLSHSMPYIDSVILESFTDRFQFVLLIDSLVPAGCIQIFGVAWSVYIYMVYDRFCPTRTERS
jgi:hypothetical protein